MIKREHIKQAIDAISMRNKEIGYSLDEMLGMGLINIASGEIDPAGDEGYHFFFEGRRVLVNRVLFFQEGTAPIEQGLLINYGELVKRQEIQERGGSPDYPAALKEIHDAGLRMAVLHEIDYAIERIEKGQKPDNGSVKGRDQSLIDTIKRIQSEDTALSIQETSLDPSFLYKGVLSGSAAFFMCFPFCMGSLMQVADLNLEFFSVRFVLNCLLRGVERNLQACVVQDRIVGLVFLSLKEQFLRRSLEIKYIATQRGKAEVAADSSSGPPRGVGTFLVAGVWMLARNEMQNRADIVLDAEVGARGFYETIGFESRGFSGFVLGKPRPYLLQALLGMARNSPDLRQSAVEEIARIIRRHVKGLRKKPSTEKDLSERKAMIECVRECLMPDSRHEFMDAAIQGLLKYSRKIMESEDLLRYASELKANRVKNHVHTAGASHQG
ncbi:MAG: hypothetical protein CVU57_28360 [Deltaproteobacteria bacterium HGW-Deltaproteobacteria-15]|jgi:hypothetical protein|nr:MAG: hypothetical protein CVU57_28360 [Deltaproteobacteria bacterium HGW-Deltaproteobacteria-15]